MQTSILAFHRVSIRLINFHNNRFLTTRISMSLTIQIKKMSTTTIIIKSQTKCFSGLVLECTHTSQGLGCSMNVHIFRPPQTLQSGQKAPVLFFLSGLTCTDTNFIFKAGAMAFAAEHGIALVCPDTSPRGEDVPKGDSWDFGQGAGEYKLLLGLGFCDHHHHVFH